MPTKSGLNFTSFGNWMKNYYINRGMLNELMYKSDSFFKTVQKLPATQNVQGNKIVYPVRYGRHPGASRDFSTAQTLAKTKTGAREAFIVDVDSDFAVARVDNKTIYASAGNMGAFVQAAKDEMDDALRGLSERRSSDLQSAGYSVRGQVGSIASNRLSITLKVPSDSVNFDIGDVLQFAASQNTGDARQTGASASDNLVTVAGVSRSNGVITLSSAMNASNNVAANDYIFRQGDFKADSLKGLQSWLPATAPIATDNHYGVNRSLDPDRLSGFRDTAVSGDSYSALVQDMAAKIMNLTSRGPDCVWINPLRFSQFSQELTSKIRYNNAPSTGTDGFSDLVIHTAAGALPVKISTWIPRDIVYVLRMETWCLYYLSARGKQFVDFIEGDEGYAISAYDDAGIELRAESYGAFGCFAPGCNGRINVAAKTL